ncbi:ABC transporter permease [Arachnia propionica]|uniref:ABC transporter permease n=1 Tax=Arachnia propionica TaxID=1750 RepID=A0A3P1WWK5_9ACTN|nr:ABC transporter permease [Arachnia propionica]RRD50595.1 ABC transporter permease [Arachnia propionica]
MNLTWFRIELARSFRDVSNLLFTFVLPVMMYLLFGTSEYAERPFGNGNVAFQVMASMGGYAAVISATATAALAATEATLGWGRQLGLTRLRPSGFIAMKVLTGVTMGGIASGLVFVVGALSGAKADSWWLWVLTWLIGLVGSALFALYGLGTALLMRSENAVGIASGAIVFLAFFGNVFNPLEGIMLQIARFTPMYGYVGLMRWPQLEGKVLQPTGETITDSVWVLIANVVAWGLVFTVLALFGQRRSRTRL